MPQPDVNAERIAESLMRRMQPINGAVYAVHIEAERNASPSLNIISSPSASPSSTVVVPASRSDMACPVAFVGLTALASAFLFGASTRSLEPGVASPAAIVLCILACLMGVGVCTHSPRG